MANNFITVQTLHGAGKRGLAVLLNSSPWFDVANKEYLKVYASDTASLGDTVKVYQPIRTQPINSLNVIGSTVQPIVEKPMFLTLNGEASNSLKYNVQEALEFLKNDMNIFFDRYGNSLYTGLGDQIIKDVTYGNAVLGMPGIAKSTYLAFGDGVSDITSYAQLRALFTQKRSIGATQSKMKMILPETTFNKVVANGFTQFLIDRNNESVSDWLIGRQDGVEFYKSNINPVHNAGAGGVEGDTLTVTSATTNADGYITSISFTGASTNVADYAVPGDIIKFPIVQPAGARLVWLTDTGFRDSGIYVTALVTAAATSALGAVTIFVEPVMLFDALATNNQRTISTDIIAGFTCKIMPTHQIGLLIDGDGYFLSVPPMMGVEPFTTENTRDPNSNVSIQTYTGPVFGSGTYLYTCQALYAALFAPRYCVRIMLPPDNASF